MDMHGPNGVAAGDVAMRARCGRRYMAAIIMAVTVSRNR